MNSDKKDEEESISDVAAEAAEMKEKEKELVTAEAAEANNNIVGEHMDAETADEENIESNIKRDNMNN
eukprot:15710196-Heterocapsa_arctica.AAC.1